MAVAEKVGFDRRGNTFDERPPEGEELTSELEEIENITVNVRKVVWTLRCKEKRMGDDLLVIADRYRAFRAKNREPRT